MSENIPIRKPASDQVNENIDVSPEVLEKLQQEAKPEVVDSKFDFPTEVIDLPSKGFFYSKDSPLSSGKIDIKYMTAREEDILTSQNLIKKGVVLDRLLEALIVTPGVSLDDILVGDKNAIFIAARILAYGAKYETSVKCPSCGVENKFTVPLDGLENKPFDFSKYTKGVNSFTVELPISKKTVTYKLLTHREETRIEEELQGLSKVNKGAVSPEVTTRLKHVIQSVDGNSDKQKIRDFVDNMLSRDTRVLRSAIKETSPDIDTQINFECSECGHGEVITLPIGVNFFWPDA